MTVSIAEIRAERPGSSLFQQADAAQRVGSASQPAATAPTIEFSDARRVQESFCAPAERKALNWLARQMPDWVTPDHLTILGLAAQLFAGACFALGRWFPAFLLIVDLFIAINWFGDSLDGTLARYRKKLRPRYGFYVDHITDTYGALFLLAGLTISGYISERIAVGMLIGFLLLSVNAYLSTYTMGVFRLSFGKFSPTEMRILLSIGTAYAYFHPYVHLFGAKHLFFDVGGIGGIIGMVLIFVFSTVQNTVALYRTERIR
jgi:archaetidylinositol phosphate synthase